MTRKATCFLAVLVFLVLPACRHITYMRYKEAGNDAVMTKDPARAAWYYEKAVAQAERMNPPKKYLAHPLLMLAVSYRRAGHPAQAIEAAERVLPIVEWVDGKRSQKAHIGILVLGRANADLGRYEKAATYFQRALEISEARDGPGGQQTGRDLYWLADARFRQGEFTQAEGLFERMVEIRRDSSGKSELGVARGLDKLGQARLKQKAYADAGDAFTEAVALTESSRGSDYPALAPTLADLADVRRHQSRPGEADALLARANRIRLPGRMWTGRPTRPRETRMLIPLEHIGEKSNRKPSRQASVISIRQRSRLFRGCGICLTRPNAW